MEPVSTSIANALNLKFERFPDQTSTIESLGATLDGWLFATLTGRGFATENAFSENEKLYHLPAMTNATVMQIANKIASFGGIWIAVEPKKATLDSGGNTSSLIFHSFNNLDAAQVEQEVCRIP